MCGSCGGITAAQGLRLDLATTEGCRGLVWGWLSGCCCQEYLFIVEPVHVSFSITLRYRSAGRRQLTDKGQRRGKKKKPHQSFFTSFEFHIIT